MDKKQHVMNFIVKHKEEIKTIGVVGLAFAGGIVTKKSIDSWRGKTLVRLLKGNDTPTVVTNIETLLLKADIPYRFVYDPEYKQYYLTIN